MSAADALGYVAGRPSGQTESPAQIAQTLRGAGFPADQLATGVAIAEIESSGQVGAIGRNTGAYAHQEDLGLLQIGYDPTRGLHTQFDPTKLVTDAAYNARAALQLYQQSGWSPWGPDLQNPRFAALKAQAQTVVGNDTGSVSGSLNADVVILAVFAVLLIVLLR
jgi:Lysozyme like domain